MDQLRLMQERKSSRVSSSSPLSQGSAEAESSLEQLPWSELLRLQQETRVKSDRLERVS